MNVETIMSRVRRGVCILLFAIAAGKTSAQSQDTSATVLPTLDYNNPKKYHIKDIKVSGIRYFSPSLILKAAGLRVGDTVNIPGDYISNAISALWEQRDFSDVKILVQFNGEDAYLDVVLKEQPRILEYHFTGVSKNQAKELENRLKIKKRKEFSEYQMKTSIDIIKRFLYEKGYYNAEVNVSVKDDERMKNFLIVTFNIDKKSKVKIGEIVIDGNSQLKENKLKKAMKDTREKKFVNMLKGAKFKEDKFEDDKINLVDYMQSKGFRDAIILSDSIYPINDKRIGILLKIDEGKKYYYRNISWIGNKKYSSDYLSMILGVKKGDTYDRKNMNARLGNDGESVMKGELTIGSIYRNDGHLAFNVEPVETVVENDSIDIEIRMSEGNQFTVNNVIITGNDRTHDRVIRRDLYLMPGELYDESMLITSMTNLGAMDHFEPESIQPSIEPVSEDLVDIRYNLVEKSSDQFEVSGGWGGGMFVASVGVTFNNLSLRKVFDKKAWRPYPAGDNQSLRISAQTNGTYYKALSFSFLEPWLGGKKPTNFSLSVYYSSESDAYYAWQAGDSRFRTIGVSVGIGKRMKWPDPNFNITGELSYQSYNLKDWDYFLMTNGKSNIISLGVSLSRNSTDNVIFPTRGSNFLFRVTATPPYSLFNNKDYSDPTMPDSERYRWIEYYKLNGSFRWFLPMSANNRLVLMTKAEFGYLGHYNPAFLSPFEGFTMGGDGVSGYNLYGIQDVGLRGYDEGELTPYTNSGEQAKVYTKYTAELRYPVVREGNSTVYALIFAEAGNAYRGWRSFNPFDLKRSAGVGVRLYLPVVGMFGIDWGYGFDRVPGGGGAKGGSQLHFSIGGEF